MFRELKGLKGNGSADKVKKIREIYLFLLSETDYLKEVGKKIEKEADRFLKADKVNFSSKTCEEVRDELFALTELAKEEGFIQGFRYAVMLTAECYAGSKLL